MKYFNNPATSVKSGKYPHKRMRTHVYKNYPQGEMTVTDGISLQDFVYKDELDSQAWSIKDSSRTIIGYKCQKAECSFRGRNYIAWFTPDIPINDGPWKFSGLPGLIMEVYDSGRQYHFSITGIEKSNEPIVLSKSTLQSGKYSKTKRTKFLKAKKQYLMNTGGFIKAETGIDLGSDAKVMRYDLIERDY
jgi:GLPGLI family protein